MPVKIETRNNRIYLVGDTYPIKDKLKQAGCRFDKDAKQWYGTTDLRTELTRIIAESASKNASGQSGDYVEPTPEELGRKRILAKVEYKGRNYYAVAKSRTGKYLLTPITCQFSFWALESVCSVVKEYQQKTDRNGNDDSLTLDSLREFLNSKDPDSQVDEPEDDCEDTQYDDDDYETPF